MIPKKVIIKINSLYVLKSTLYAYHIDYLIGKDIDIAQVMIDEEWAVPFEEKPLSRPPITDVPVPPMLPPTFGDLECSR